MLRKSAFDEKKYFRKLVRNSWFYIFTFFTVILLFVFLSFKLFEYTQFTWLSFDFWQIGPESPSTFLRNIGLFILGLIGLPIAIMRSFAALGQLKVAEITQVNDSFTRAIEQIGASEVNVRLGGIYSLIKIAESHPKEYLQIVFNVLHSFLNESGEFGASSEEIDYNDVVGSDIQAAYIYLCHAYLQPLRILGVNLNYSRCDNATLINSQFTLVSWNLALFEDCKFEEVTFIECKLVSTKIENSDFTKSSITHSDLHKAKFNNVKFESCDFYQIEFSDVKFKDVEFVGCVFTNVSFKDSELRFCNFINCFGIEDSNLQEAKLLAHLSGDEQFNTLYDKVKKLNEPKLHEAKNELDSD